MFQAFLIKYAEIGIKGKNRYLFEDALVQQIRYALKKTEGSFQVSKEQGRIYVHALTEYDFDETVESLQRVFGITGICPVMIVEDEGFDALAGQVIRYMGEVYHLQNTLSADSTPGAEDAHTQLTFKVHARRARKNYPMNSMEIDAAIGEKLLDAYPTLKVDVHKPEILLQIEVRSRIYIYSRTIPGPGGMPVGTNGKAMLLLSGGIDSPVAGYMIAKRGVKLDAVYFHAPPYTSERAKQKVVDLAHILASFAGPVYLHVVNFTAIQMYIYDKCPHDELTIIMRRYMMRIAEHFAVKQECLGLVTGESIGQVASQTMQSLAATDEVCTMPVYRPVIGFDKQEIIDVAQKIGTFETSILPYEDCCTIFVAKHPVTKPSRRVIARSEQKLSGDVDRLVREALDTTELLIVR